jgi:integrase
MSIYRDKASGVFVFEFSRRIEGRRVRAQKRLPRAWNQAQADAFDRKESARLYALATSVGGAERSIDDAVEVYVRERLPELKHGKTTGKELQLMSPYYTGRPLSALADVCTAYRKKATREQSATEIAAKVPPKPLAPATIKNRIRYLTAACRYAWKMHAMCENDPAARVTVPEVRNARTVFLTRAEVLTLARACKDPQTRAAILIAFYSGMRADEIRRARVVGTAFMLNDTKNSDPRIIPIHPNIRRYVGKPQRTKFAQHYHFGKAKKAIGMPGLRFHDLRHSAASAMVAAGASANAVGAVLGHRSAQSMKRYTHFMQEQLREAVFSVGRKVA